MKIIPLSEGSFTVDKTKKFIPFDEATDRLANRNAGSLLVEIQPFVVITSIDILLLDTGLGFQKNGRLQLHDNLIRAGIHPGEITKVLVSHLHKDHSGGLQIEKPNGETALSFPQATYYLQRRELDYALSGESSSYVQDEIKGLYQHPQIVLLDGNEVLDETIFFELTGAHSKYHQVIWIKEAGEIIFFGGDDAPQLQQMKHKFAAKYDYDGKKAMHLRQEWWSKGQKEHWQFLFYHDVKNPVKAF
ncbi:MAG: MBL fold metallo-hydrolase [Chitinophagaceae bacterium]|nr:MBL fold metallo-hydrolase [Chitinophagaceae bacterium]